MPTDNDAGPEVRGIRGLAPGRRREAASAPVRLADLAPAERRRSIALCAITVVLSWVFIFGAYFLLPIGRESSVRAGVRLAADIALVGAILFWQTRRIARA